jgi:Tol biopolymer transport system component
MRGARLSPDGHAVAFVSPVGGIEHVFLMLSSGGEPLQLKNDEGDKFVDNFSPDGKEVYYGRNLGKEEIWAVPTLGGNAHRVASGVRLDSLNTPRIFRINLISHEALPARLGDACGTAAAETRYRGCSSHYVFARSH